MNDIEKLEDLAVDAAINTNWDKAIELNKSLLKIDPENVNSYLRMGYAYLQLSDLKRASKYFKKTLQVQPKNNIATEHLERIKILETKKKSVSPTQIKYNPNLFLEIPGNTKIVHLVNLGQKEDIAGLNIGKEVFLKEKKRRIEIRTKSHNEYVGNLPDDISKRLLYFINEKSKYDIYIKEVDLTDVVVFIREISKGKKVMQYPSFPSNPHILLTDIQKSDESATDEDDQGDGESEGEQQSNTWVEEEDDDEPPEERDKDLDSIVQLEDEDEE